jgi:hypothetical protein
MKCEVRNVNGEVFSPQEDDSAVTWQLHCPMAGHLLRRRSRLAVG